MSLRLVDALPMLTGLLGSFDKLKAWEQDLVSGIVRIGASGTMTELTTRQADSIATLYCRYVLVAMLPETHRTLEQEKARQRAATADATTEKKP